MESVAGPNRDGHVNAQDWPERVPETPSVCSGLILSRQATVLQCWMTHWSTPLKPWTIKLKGLAYDRLSGELVWSTSGQVVVMPIFARANGSWIRSTPLLDKNRLYVMGMQETLVCLDAGSGNFCGNFQRQGTQTPAILRSVSSPLIEGSSMFKLGVA